MRAMLMSSPRGHRVDEELAVVVDEDWTHRVVNPHALSLTVGANVDGLDQR